MAWLFAVGAGILGEVLGHYTPGVLGSVLGIAIFGAGGWAAVHMTTGSTGKGIVTVLVGSLAAAVAAYFIWKMKVSGSSQFDEALQQAQQNGQPLTPEQMAIAKKAGGAIAGGTAAFFVMFQAFLFGMIGCFIGGATRKSATGGGAAEQKAA
jgi:hypothetical protein